MTLECIQKTRRPPASESLLTQALGVEKSRREFGMEMRSRKSGPRLQCTGIEESLISLKGPLVAQTVMRKPLNNYQGQRHSARSRCRWACGCGPLGLCFLLMTKKPR